MIAFPSDSIDLFAIVPCIFQCKARTSYLFLISVGLYILAILVKIGSIIWSNIMAKFWTINMVSLWLHIRHCFYSLVPTTMFMPRTQSKQNLGELSNLKNCSLYILVQKKKNYRSMWNAVIAHNAMQKETFPLQYIF